MPPKKILIIDDEPAIQMLYNEEFVDAGYTVASAYNGEEGLAAFTENPPDLVILENDDGGLAAGADDDNLLAIVDDGVEDLGVMAH